MHEQDQHYQRFLQHNFKEDIPAMRLQDVSSNLNQSSTEVHSIKLRQD